MQYHRDEQTHRSEADNLNSEGVLVMSDHIQGNINTCADYLSGQLDDKNYHLNKEVFKEIYNHLKKGTIGIFWRSYPTSR